MRSACRAGSRVYEALWQRYGTMDWPELWAPAIRLAEEGVAITDYISARIADRAETLARYPHSAAQYLPNGRVPAAGERWSAPNLAKTPARSWRKAAPTRSIAARSPRSCSRS